jgi:hypothetical protein
MSDSRGRCRLVCDGRHRLCRRCRNRNQDRTAGGSCREGPGAASSYIYERGHYGWDGQQYVWSEGRFIQERPGHVYKPYAFECRGEVYYYRPGFWDDNQK